ncbi:acetoin catabolism regulatory protein (plasmid) [Dinoroseobacter shibae DFL 12 = DSM 16493]|uniref:Acetoin catabolism regulatory protein n=1 Tax=Dinoroseobacter shibae (strain DSM 16493 / NCIMB 14021 / DFL 12) TaxID=398580 RepID=A8LUE9_DINSH|nr:sigma-54-dependent Fis family transcriptional regulator [Dinoroseobacter shibae]ABV95866.1 acetoin catabolism regulatory protein [Dinoroseobacter shibae DFL 12 = DSM 16493]URF49181.1 sigma-54-dependent Fis family transcriptional regulator [Dinoroseobacter shibae]URF53489.1 sigma-54-dependent Fis family transcriptional regulator [Dinoroseobacter shibae]
MGDLAHVTEIDRVVSGRAQGSLRDAVVTESWRRCVESYGLNPTATDAPHIVTDAELRAHREQAERLIAVARSGLQGLFKQVAGHNYVLLLADAQGVCVDFFGDPRFEDELRSAGLYLGSNWQEELAGTCGVGSCIVTGEAVTIHQDDHFGLAHTPLSCTAAPIYDSLGQLSAVLDISLLRSPTPKSSQNLAMSLVKASARRVEMANLMATARQDWVLRFSTSPEFLEVDPEAAVSLDGAGRITGLTHAAQAALGATDPGALLGTRIDALMEMSIDDLPDLMRGRPTEERVLRLRDGRGVFGHAIAPQAPRTPRPAAVPEMPAPLAGFAGPDPVLTPLLRRLGQLAGTEVPLLLLGETGTGKERLARAVHLSGPAGRGFTVLRCAGLGRDPLPEPPAGTLFLRGVEDLDTAGQGAVLALLEARPDLRAIASARTDISAAVKAGAFRSDLFFRLAGHVAHLPPLRLRHDLEWLLTRLMRRHVARDLSLSPAARAELSARNWPGNIRELQSTLDVAAALAEGRVIDLPDLPGPSLPEAAAAPPEADLQSLLDACGWNMSQAARRLGVNRSTVLRRVRKAGLTPPS